MKLYLKDKPILYYVTVEATPEEMATLKKYVNMYPALGTGDYLQVGLLKIRVVESEE